jgi:hypothetical protein
MLELFLGSARLKPFNLLLDYHDAKPRKLINALKIKNGITIRIFSELGESTVLKVGGYLQ